MDWTLQIGATVKTLTELGLEEDNINLYRHNGAATVLKIIKPGPMDAALLAEFKAEVILRRAGDIYFRGYADQPVRTGSGEQEAIAYEFRDWWWKAEKAIYHQYWHRVTSIAPDGSKVYSDTLTPNVFLGVALDGTRWTNGQQITDALNWLITVAGPVIQVGIIDPAVNIFSVEGRSVSVAEVIRTMMAHSPDNIVVTDYSTTPPTVAVRKPNKMPVVTMTAGVDPIVELSLTPKYDLQVPVVVIHLKRTDEIDGKLFPAWGTQIYPPNTHAVNPVTGAPFTDIQWQTQVGGLITTLELEGSQKQYAKGSIITEVVQANSTDAATRVAWWQEFEKPLAGANIDPASITVTTPTSVKDRAGADVVLANYQYRLLGGSIASWMDVTIKREITIKATASYTLYSVDVAAWKAAHSGALPPDNLIVKKVKDRELQTELNLCDYNTNGEEEPFQTTASFIEAEPEPLLLAKSYYDSLATLQYQGTITDVNQELPDQNLLGCKLTLAGTALIIENQYIQEVTENLGTGIRTITIGPPAVLDLTELMDLHRASRYRRVWNNPQVKVSGDPGSDNALDIGGTGARQDTTSGNGNLGISANASKDSAGLALNEQTIIQQDAVNQQTVHQVIKADGTQKLEAGIIKIGLPALAQNAALN